ncbi:hypothetical protein L1049_003831 [Liquidambar formosana]|uniref:Uncharacterized protein n=1 Tax=Liquidambar formosana TaxID=63359 RepID=A0AAP0RRW1_LIQFO
MMRRTMCSQNFLSPGGAEKCRNANLQSFGGEKQDEAHTWSAVSKEVEALGRLNEIASSSSSHSAYSKANKFCKGVGGKAKPKPKFSFRFQSQKGELSWPSIPKDGNDFSSRDENDVSYKVHEFREGLETVQHGIMEPSMA